MNETGASLFETFPYRFTLKPLLFAGKAMQYHGLRQGNDYDFLISREEFRSLHKQIPDHLAVNSTEHRVLRFGMFEFYEQQFGYDYLLLCRHAIDQRDYLVLSVDMLLFLAILRMVHEPQMPHVKHDFVLLVQKLGLWPLLSEQEPAAQEEGTP
jgi:hypothetical protein